MNLEEVFNESFNYTQRFIKDDFGRYIILAVLSVIPVLNLIVLGYGCKVVKETSPSPPKLENFVDLWIQGLKVVVVTVIYMLIPIILITLSFYSIHQFRKIEFFWVFPPTFLSTINFSFLSLGFILTFLFSIVLVVAIVHMIKLDNFSKAFSLNEIFRVIGNIGWGKYLAWLVIVFVLWLIIWSLGRIPFIGWVIVLLLTPLLLVFIAKSINLLYSSVTIGIEA